MRFQNIGQLRTALDSGAVRSYGSPVMTLKDTIDNHYTGYGGGAAALRDAPRSSGDHTAKDVVDGRGGDGVLMNGADVETSPATCNRVSDEFRRQSSPGPVPLRHRPPTDNQRAYPRQVRQPVF